MNDFKPDWMNYRTGVKDGLSSAKDVIEAAKFALQAIDEGWLFEDIDKKVAPRLRAALEQVEFQGSKTTFQQP